MTQQRMPTVQAPINGPLLRAARAVIDVSRRELAESAGLSRNTVARLETDPDYLRTVRYETLRRLVAVLEKHSIQVSIEPDGTAVLRIRS